VALLLSWHVGLLLGLSACATSAAAAASLIRCYILKALRMALLAMSDPPRGNGERVTMMRR
jgi:hypothetical protein